MVQAFKYKLIECKNNEGLFLCIDQLKIDTVHRITDRPKYRTILLIFHIWSLYDSKKINRTFIILLSRQIELPFDCLTMLQKSRLCFGDIEYFVHHFGSSLVGDLENSVQAAGEHVG